MTAAEALGLIATFLYALSSLLLYRQFRGQAAPSRVALMLPGGLAVASHAAGLYFLLRLKLEISKMAIKRRRYKLKIAFQKKRRMKNNLKVEYLGDGKDTDIIRMDVTRWDKHDG